MPRRSAATTSIPLQCPFCQTTQIVHTGRMTDDTYYRCQQCGQIWNPLRVLGSEKVEGRSSK